MHQSHRQDSTYHGLCYTSRGALTGMRNSSMGPPHEGSIRTTHRTMSERSYHGATFRSCTLSLQQAYLVSSHSLSDGYLAYFDIFYYTN